MEGFGIFLQWPSENHLVEQRVFVVCSFLWNMRHGKKNGRNFHDNKSPVKRAVKVTAHREVQYFHQYSFSVGLKQNMRNSVFFLGQCIVYVNRNADNQNIKFFYKINPTFFLKFVVKRSELAPNITARIYLTNL